MRPSGDGPVDLLFVNEWLNHIDEQWGAEESRSFNRASQILGGHPANLAVPRRDGLCIPNSSADYPMETPATGDAP